MVVPHSMSALPLLTTSKRVRALTSTNAIRKGRFSSRSISRTISRQMSMP